MQHCKHERYAQRRNDARPSCKSLGLHVVVHVEPAVVILKLGSSRSLHTGLTIENICKEILSFPIGFVLLQAPHIFALTRCSCLS